jgi:hypothetical protein
MDLRLPGSPRKWCMTARMRSRLTFASLALPVHSRQRRRSTSSTITAFAAARSGRSDDSAPATCVRCCSRMAIWNQSKIGSSSTPALRRTRRSPGQPSVNAVRRVPSVRPTASRLRRISAAGSVSALATAPKTCRLPPIVSTLPIRTSRCRSPSSQLRMKVESKVATMASAGGAGLAAIRIGRLSAILKVWRRRVSGSTPTSTGNSCASTSAAVR